MKQAKLWITGLILLLGVVLPAGARTEIEFGDVNNDQSIDIIDALATARFSVGLIPPVFIPEAADVDADGKITIVDALMIARYAVGCLTVFPAEESGRGIKVINSGLPRNPDPEASEAEVQSAVAGINQFGFDCYKELRENDENLFFSPMSINYALAMCYAGAGGNTKDQMEDVMHIGLTDIRYHNALNSLDLSITAEQEETPSGPSPELKLKICNSTWGQQNYDFQQPFLDILALHYGAAMRGVDFITEPENCRFLINNWISEHTEDKITDLMPTGSITPDTRLVITNTIYFKARWKNEFDPYDTTIKIFRAPQGITIVQMMQQKFTASYKNEPGRYEIIRLPYRGIQDNAMYIILPTENEFDTIENLLSEEYWEELCRGMSYHKVMLEMPQFRFEWEASLKSALSTLGMSDAFSPLAADFRGITTSENLLIDDIRHKSFISVDEEGTEAAAATSGTILPGATEPSVNMIIDHPFIFLIKSETGANLFIGRVMNP